MKIFRAVLAAALCLTVFSGCGPNADAWEDVSGTLSDELSVGTCKDVSGTLSVGASIVVSGIVAKASDVGLSNIVCSSIVCVCVSCLIISVVSSANEYCGM